MRKTWREAVWDAVQRQAAKNLMVTRQQLIDHELDTIKAEALSTGATPEQTLSRVLQDLRDQYVLIFDGNGHYRLAPGQEGVAVDTAVVTETQRLQDCRIGQSRFRKKLDERWHHACPLTGIGQRELLRASHIVPWNRCESAAERLSVDNGLLLSALWDAAFDRAIAAFDDDGMAMFASRIAPDAQRALRQAQSLVLPLLTTPLREYLARHRSLHAKNGLRRAA